MQTRLSSLQQRCTQQAIQPSNKLQARLEVHVQPSIHLQTRLSSLQQRQRQVAIIVYPTKTFETITAIQPFRLCFFSRWRGFKLAPYRALYPGLWTLASCSKSMAIQPCTVQGCLCRGPRFAFVELCQLGSSFQVSKKPGTTASPAGLI